VTGHHQRGPRVTYAPGGTHGNSGFVSGTQNATPAAMKLLLRLLMVSAAGASAAIGQHSGDTPPALEWSKLKGNCPASLDWADLGGRVVVISFGNDDVFPDETLEWNEISGKFQADPVLFIRVAGGSEFLLDRALDKTAYQGCILFDENGANRRHFGLPNFPRTVVVNQLGYIAGYARGDIDADGLRAVLNHESDTGLSETPPQPKSLEPAATDELPSYEVHIAPAQKDEFPAFGQGGPDRYVTRNQPLKSIIMGLWETPPVRISFPDNLDQSRYDVIAHLPVSDSGLLLDLVRQEVASYFGLNIYKEERPQRVYVLTATARHSKQLRPAKKGEEAMCGAGERSIAGTAQLVESIAAGLEDLLRNPVIDQTGMKGKYDYSAASELSGPEAAADIAHQLGLELTPAEQTIEMLVVRKVQ